MFSTLSTISAQPAVATAMQGWHGGPPFFLFPIFFIVFWAVIVVVFVTLRRGGWRARSDARGVLADRFARGDISAEEYRMRLSELARK